MAKKNIADKYWIYGEDAELAARLTSYLTRVVYNQRANYIRALMKIKEHECSIEDCDSDIESQSMRSGNSLEESIESKLMWEAIRKYLPKDVCAALRSSYGHALKIYRTEIPISTRTAESASSAHSVLSYDASGPASIAYKTLAKEVVENERVRKQHHTSLAR